MAMTDTVAPAAPKLVILSLTLEQLVPSPTNPRRTFDEGRLDELAASMRTHGILQPLVVRRAKPSVHLKGGDFYEIVAGERRFRAAKRAQLAQVPAVLRELSDIQVLESQLIENGQREDIHPIEAADTFVALQKLDGSYNPKAIASKIGKSERYVQNVLHYAVLVPEAKKAFLAQQINAGHADLIARLKPADQLLALKACFHNLFGEDKDQGCISVRQLDRWIKESIRIDPVAEAPSFPELQKLVDEKKGDAPAALSTVLQVAGSYSQTPATKGLMSPADYRVVEKKQTCGHMRRAFIVIGEDRGKLMDICTAKTSCKVHWKHNVEELERSLKTKQRPVQSSRTALDKREEEQRRKARERDKVLNEVAELALKRLDKHPPTKPTAAVLRVIAWDRGEKPSWAVVARGAIENCLAYGQIAIDYKMKIGMLKPLGIDLVAIEKELTAKGAKAASKTADPKIAARASQKKNLAKLKAPKKRKAGKKR